MVKSSIEGNTPVSKFLMVSHLNEITVTFVTKVKKMVSISLNTEIEMLSMPERFLLYSLLCACTY